MKKQNEIYFPSAIYSEELIDRAILDYGSICTVIKKRLPNGVLCIFVKSIADIELTINEFSNYLIELYNAHREK